MYARICKIAYADPFLSGQVLSSHQQNGRGKTCNITNITLFYFNAPLYIWHLLINLLN